MFLDPMWLLIVVLPALVIGGLATLLTKGTFAKYSRVASRHGYTGAEAAFEMLRRNGVQGVRIEPVGGLLTDHSSERFYGYDLAGFKDGESFGQIAKLSYIAGPIVSY